MITIEKNPTCTNNKILKKSNANSDRLFIETSTELLRKGHHVKFRAPGDSMYPTICDGDIVTVMPIETGSISIGDILLYRHKSGVTAHRVIRLAKGGTNHSQYSTPVPHSSDPCPHYVFFLRGDAALVFDDPVSADHILGKVTLVEREGRRIDPYSFTAKIRFKARRLAARLNRLLLPPNSRSV
jgi:hypothetical protein